MPAVSRIDGPALAVTGAGGALGAGARYAMDVMAGGVGLALPWATLAINILGCALMGLLFAYVLAHPDAHALWKPFLGAGVLGGFTTFSAFAGDAVVLAEGDAWPMAAAYLVVTLVGCLGSFALARELSGVWLRRGSRA